MKKFLLSIFFLPCFIHAQLAWINNVKFSQFQMAPFIRTDLSGNVLLWGHFFANSLDAYSGTFLQKYNADGKLTWMDLTSSAGVPDNSGLAIDASGNIYVAISKSEAADGPGAIWINGIRYDGGTGYLIKYSRKGDFLWVKSTGLHHYPHDISVNKLNQVILTEEAEDGCSLRKYDENGALLSSVDICGHHIAVDGNDNIFVTDDDQITKYSPTVNYLWSYPLDGSDNRLTLDETGNAYLLSRNEHTKLTKFGRNGDLKWQREFAFNSYAISTGSGHVSILCEAQRGDSRALMIRLFDTDGREGWTYEIPASSDWMGEAITESGNALYISATGIKVHEAYIMRVNAGDMPTSIEEDPVTENLFSVYPNPSKQFSINFENKNNEPFSVKVYDVSGKCVYSKNYSANSCRLNDQIDMSAFAKGIYSLQLVQNRYTHTKKLVVE